MRLIRAFVSVNLYPICAIVGALISIQNVITINVEAVADDT